MIDESLSGTVTAFAGGGTSTSTDEDASVDADKSTKKWRLFEQIIAIAEAELDGAADVAHNQIVMGEESKTPRQVDVLARGKVARSPLMVVIECKHYTKKIGIGKVDELVGKLQDIGAAHGILYAYSGVTGPAQARANGARRPTIEIRDFTATETELEQLSAAEVSKSGNSVSFPALLQSVAREHGSQLARSVERRLSINCEAGTGCHGVVDIEGYADEIPWGNCDGCGSLHILCECDGVPVLVHQYGGTESCFCGAEYQVLFGPDADLRHIDLLRHGTDCVEAEVPTNRKDATPQAASGTADLPTD
jgi:hypothetical protein